ncbi:hypothetical protein MLD38_035658 [Melastoma candidum]|uniref:Uncharacterized protein n=1 Tax=Melastoma candidum TaxID=119954 RepID=A0ACB9LI78_9MYRT|nr:hypothetical protein MLD38_035658 [Melastoma candidum]
MVSRAPSDSVPPGFLAHPPSPVVTTPSRVSSVDTPLLAAGDILPPNLVPSATSELLDQSLPAITSSLPDVNTIVTIKLSADNYQLWLSVMTSYLVSVDLYRHVDCMIRAPPTTVTLPTGVVVPNPRLPLWHRTNHSVRALLLATMTPEIMVKVYDVFPAYEIWSMINRRFLESTLARELELRETLITRRLTTQSMAEYLRAMKSTADQLASIGRPVPLSESLLYTLWGLPSQYEHLVTTFSFAIPNLTFDLVRANLLNYEQCLKHRESLDATSSATGLYSMATAPSKRESSGTTRM